MEASAMQAAVLPAERWLTEEAVAKLASVLSNAKGEHGALKHDLLGDEPVLALHVYVLARSLTSDKQLKSKLLTICGASNAFHTILYHIGGGKSAGLRPPPEPGDRAASQWSSNLFRDTRQAAAAFFSSLYKLNSRQQWSELHGLRATPYEVRLALRMDPSVQCTPQVRLEITSPALSSLEDGTGLEADSRLMIALGTHWRCGMLSPFRLLAGNSHLLERVISFAGIQARGYKPGAPPAIERNELHRHLRLQLVTIEALRCQVAELQTRNKILERERNQAVRHAEHAVHQYQVEMERSNARRMDVESNLQEAQRTCSKLQRQLQARPLKLERAHEMELHAALEEADLLRVQCLREQEHELREYQRRAADERDDALAENTELQRLVAELRSQVDRIRNTCKNGLLERVATLERLLTEARVRRTLNQRRVREANLADARANEALKREACAKQALREYGVSMEAERAATARADAAQILAAKLQAKLDEITPLLNKYRSVAEPPRSKFYQNGFTPEVDLCCIEVMLLGGGVARDVVPDLFIIFANFFGVCIPLRTDSMKVAVKKVEGKMTYGEKSMPCIPSRTHCKRLLPVLYQLHKLQVGKELLAGGLNDASYCYGSDGAESLQREFVLHQLTRRVDGKLNTMSVDLQQMHTKTAEVQASTFFDSLKDIAELCKRAGITDDISPLIQSPGIQSSINDRAATARKAARMVLAKVRGVDEKSIPDGPTCAEHAWVNILEEGRKAIDGVLRRLMNITDAQAEGDSKKVKAMRTAVGWFSSPACAVIYQVAKYVAAYSSKGYAIGEKFAQWLSAELHVSQQPEVELLGYVQDLMAICGSRSYVFFMNAAVVERFCRPGSLLTFLEEEADLGAESGGKLRHAILTGFNSPEIMAAVRCMALICDSCLFIGLYAIKPLNTSHLLDVLPAFWPRALDFFLQASETPEAVVSGELALLSIRADEILQALGAHTPRGARAAIDMQRIRAAAAGDALVQQMLTAAFKAMADGTRNHAEEFLPGGRLCEANITDEMRTEFDGCQTTSTSCERGFAIGRLYDQRCGVSRADARAGWVLGKLDNTVAAIRKEGYRTQVSFLRLAKKRARETYDDGRLAAVKLSFGMCKREERQQRIISKRAKKAAKETERTRIASIVILERYSLLVSLRNDQLQDQLKAWKLKLGSDSKFSVSHPNRTAYVLQLQCLMATNFGSEANDLPAGDSGIEGRGLKVRRSEKGAKKKQRGVQYYGEYEWDDAENEDGWIVEAIVDKQVADGKRVFANQGKKRKGCVLYQIVWEGFPPDLEWWEPASSIGRQALLEYEASLAAQAAEEAADLAEDAELDASDSDEEEEQEQHDT